MSEKELEVLGQDGEELDVDLETEVEEPVVQEVFEPLNAPEPVLVVEQTVTTVERDPVGGLHVFPLTQMDGSMFADYESLGSSNKTAFGILLRYTHDMRPKAPLSETTIANNQVMFYRTMIAILNTPMPEFNKAFGLLLKIIEKYSDGCFHQNYALREFANVRLDAADRTLFAALVESFRHLAPVKGRKVHAVQAGLERRLFIGTEATALTTVARQNIINYLTR